MILTNTTKKALFVAGRLLFPGATRECAPEDVPPELKEQLPKEQAKPATPPEAPAATTEPPIDEEKLLAAAKGKK